MRCRPSGKLAHLFHYGGQLAAVTVCVDRFAGWEELIIHKTTAASPKKEHELPLETTGFWSLSNLHLPLALVY